MVLNSNKLQADLLKIINWLKNTNCNTSYCGVAIGGSQQMGIVTEYSDIDLAFWTIDTSTDMSHRYTVYDYEHQKAIEVLTFNLNTLKTLEVNDLNGYLSETFFWMSKQHTLILDDRYINICVAFQNLLKKYEKLWLHCCLHGYEKVIKQVLSAIENKYSTVKNLSKKIYRICYMYSRATKNEVIELNTLIKLKNNQLDKLSQEEIIKLKNNIDLIKQTFKLEQNEVHKLYNDFKKAVNLLCM